MGPAFPGLQVDVAWGEGNHLGDALFYVLDCGGENVGELGFFHEVAEEGMEFLGLLGGVEL